MTEIDKEESMLFAKIINKQWLDNFRSDMKSKKINAKLSIRPT